MVEARDVVVPAGSEVSASFKLAESVEVTVFFVTTEDLTNAEVDQQVDVKLAEAGLDRALLEEARY